MEQEERIGGAGSHGEARLQQRRQERESRNLRALAALDLEQRAERGLHWH
jgi:hypothetical protein